MKPMNPVQSVQFAPAHGVVIPIATVYEIEWDNVSHHLIIVKLYINVRSMGLRTTD